MASVRWLRDGRLRIRISLAEPIQVVAVPFGCVPLLSGILMCLFLGGLIDRKIPASELTTYFPIVPVFATSSYLFWTMFTQTWEFAPLRGAVVMRRGGIPLRTLPLQGLQHLRLDKQSDSDGGTCARAIFVYEEGREFPLNRIFSGSTQELEAFVNAANKFLNRPV